MWGGKSSTFLQGNTDPRSGQVYTMYHGTSMEAAKKIKKEGFRQSDNGMLGRGVYLSRDLEKACRYPLNLCAYQRVVLKVKVEVGKVKKIDRQSHPLQDTWHDHGYDTAWCPPKCGMVPSGLEEDCVWDPKRIQSDKGMLGPGVYLSRDLKKASRYPLDLPVSQRVIVRVKVDVGKVIKIDYKRHPLQETWHDYGYNTAWCPPNCGMVRSGLEEDCVWDPERITVIDVIHPIQEEIIEQDACRTL